VVSGGEVIRAAHILKHGGIVAYATEYCFGFGCDPMNRAAVLRLLRLKRRPPSKGLILIAGDIAQLAPYVQEFPAPVRATWPGPHTWLLPPRPGVPRWITGDHPRIAVRVTAHPQAAALCRAAGMAIVSTSANVSGAAAVRSYREAMRRFQGEVDYVLPGRVGGASAPTPIRDAVTGELVRPG
jgi:L-threonylcarbamoyladenylate synthase